MRPFSVFSIHPLSTAIGMLTFAVVGVLHFASVGAVEPLRFEAETVTSPQNAWQADRASKDKWNLWSTDKDAEKKWSGGIVLQSPPVKQDRSRPEEGAPVLHTHVKSLPPGKYYVKLGSIGRPIGISLDGKTWKKIEGGGSNLGLIAVGKDGFHMLVDDRYASTTNPGSCYYDYLEFTPLPDPNRKPKVEGYAQTRIEESLDRGFVAMPVDGGRIYLGWRLLKDDPRNMAFDVYRRAGEKSPPETQRQADHQDDRLSRRQTGARSRERIHSVCRCQRPAAQGVGHRFRHAGERRTQLRLAEAQRRL